VNRIIKAIEAEIQWLQAPRTLLEGETNSRKVGEPGTGKKSADTRTKVAEAQKARWAKEYAGK
jgi:hypothetical protein